MSESLLSVEGLHVSYGTKEVLRGIDYWINESEVVAVLGANGSGKSTSLNTISGFVAALAGKVVFDGVDITNMPAHKIYRLGVIQVSQSRDLFPFLTVEHNLRLGGVIRNRREIELQLEKVFAYFPRLKERRKQLARTLSGGEQQMLAIGRALMTNPKLLILDEATEGLAPLIRNEIWNCVSSLKSAGQSILLVDKNIDALTRIADRHYIIEKGKVVWDGTSSELQGNQDLQHRFLGV